MTTFRIYFKNGQREETTLTPDEVHRRYPGQVKKVRRLDDGDVCENVSGRPAGGIQPTPRGNEQGTRTRRGQHQEGNQGQ